MIRPFVAVLSCSIFLAADALGAIAGARFPSVRPFFAPGLPVGTAQPAMLRANAGALTVRPQIVQVHSQPLDAPLVSAQALEGLFDKRGGGAAAAAQAINWRPILPPLAANSALARPRRVASINAPMPPETLPGVYRAQVLIGGKPGDFVMELDIQADGSFGALVVDDYVGEENRAAGKWHWTDGVFYGSAELTDGRESKFWTLEVDFRSVSVESLDRGADLVFRSNAWGGPIIFRVQRLATRPPDLGHAPRAT